MKFNRLTRRMFLQGSGGAFLAMPLLTSLLPRELQAQAATPVKRFISVISGYETGHNSIWLPHAAGTQTNLPQPNRVLNVANGHHPIRWQPLREFAPTSSSVLTTLTGSTFSPYLESMNIMRSLDFSSRYGHAAAHVLGGVENFAHMDRGNLKLVPTVDSVINNFRGYNSAGLPLINCLDDYNAAENGTAYSYSSIGGGVAAKSSGVNTELHNIYNQLFSNGTVPESGGTSVAHPKYNILTRVIEDYTRVRNSRNISASDRIALDNSVDKISDVQRSLNRVSTAQCSYRQLPRAGSTYNSATNADVSKAWADLITASIMCDTARTFVLGGQVMSGLFQGQADDHDTISHNPFAVFSGKPSWQILGERQAQFMRYFLGPLVQNLSAAVDPSNGRSYLYNSLIYHTYHSSQVHGWGSHPVTLFGNAGGSLTSGNYIDYANRTKGAFHGADYGPQIFSDVPGSANFSNNWHGVSYNRLLVTFLQAMGLAPSAYEDNTLNSQLYNRSNIGTDNTSLNNIGGFGYAHMGDLSTTFPGGFTAAQVPDLAALDLRQFRYPLALPPQS